MAWSDAAREAARESRRLHAKGNKPHAQLAKLVAKVGNPYPIASQMKRNYATARKWDAKTLSVMGFKTPRAYTYSRAIDQLKSQVSMRKFK